MAQPLNRKPPAPRGLDDVDVPQRSSASTEGWQLHTSPTSRDSKLHYIRARRSLCGTLTEFSGQLSSAGLEPRSGDAYCGRCSRAVEAAR